MMNKFKDQEALQKAYESLEKEFTRRSQQLKKLMEENTNISQSYIEVCDINAKLTEENGQLKSGINGLEYENTELQKQIDELKSENTELYKEQTTLIAGSILAKQNIPKDTAKEILDELDLFFKGTTFRKGYEFKKIDQKLKEMRKNYNVEN